MRENIFRRRYISFVWRIAITFVMFVVIVLVSQGVMFSYLRARSADPFGPGNTMAMASTLAAELGRELSREPSFDAGSYLHSRDLRRSVYVVTRDGRVFASGAQPLSPAIRDQMQ